MKKKSTEKTLEGAKTRQQIALEYNISERTLRRRMKKANIVLPTGLILPADQQKVYLVLGKPQIIYNLSIFDSED